MRPACPSSHTGAEASLGRRVVRAATGLRLGRNARAEASWSDTPSPRGGTVREREDKVVIFDQRKLRGQWPEAGCVSPGSQRCGAQVKESPGFCGEGRAPRAPGRGEDTFSTNPSVTLSPPPPDRQSPAGFSFRSKPNGPGGGGSILRVGILAVRKVCHLRLHLREEQNRCSIERAAVSLRKLGRAPDTVLNAPRTPSHRLPGALSVDTLVSSDPANA